MHRPAGGEEAVGEAISGGTTPPHAQFGGVVLSMNRKGCLRLTLDAGFGNTLAARGVHPALLPYSAAGRESSEMSELNGIESLS